MTDFISDGSPFETPESAAAEGYATTPPSFGAGLAALYHGSSTLEPLSRFVARSEYEPEGLSGIAGRALAVAGEMGGGTAALPPSAAGGMPTMEAQPSTMLSADEANARYAPTGPDGKPQPITSAPIPEPVAQLVGKAKADEIERNGVIARFENAHSWPVDFAAGTAAFMLDPLNAATAFLPGIGEETITARLGGGFLARTAGRAVAGGTAGLVSQAPLTALRYALGTQEASDYELRDAFRDMAFAAAGGAVLQAGLGTIGDALRSRRGVAPAPQGVAGGAPIAIGPVTAPLAREALVAPLAAAPAPETAPTAAPSVINLGGMGHAITGNLYDGLFEALQNGEDTFAGVRDPVLARARPAFDRGLIKSPDELRAFVNSPDYSSAAPAAPTASFTAPSPEPLNPFARMALENAQRDPNFMAKATERDRSLMDILTGTGEDATEKLKSNDYPRLNELARQYLGEAANSVRGIIDLRQDFTGYDEAVMRQRTANESRPAAAAPTPAATEILTAPATAKADAMRAAVSEILDGRPVEVSPIFPQAAGVPPTLPGIPSTVFRGTGRAQQGSVYNEMAGGALFGGGRYWAFSREDAERFGPNIEAKSLGLQNPLVIRNDDEWRALTKRAGWQYMNPIGMAPEQRAKEIAQMQALLRREGHDGLIVHWNNATPYDVDARGNAIKGVRNVFGVPQAYELPTAGQTAERPPISVRPIREDQAVLPSGAEVPVRYAIAEAGDLVPSQRPDFSPNPEYPAELQPRDRTRSASALQVQDIARNLNPRLLDHAANASDGAPIIGPDGVVESGNGRTLAITDAYRSGGPAARAYRDYLAQQGYPVEGVREPVLVRVRQAPMTFEERAAFAREANQRTTLALGAAEQARSDAAALSDDVLALHRGGDIGTAGNRDFVRAFIRDVAGPTEQAGMLTGDGGLSVAGRRRVEGALLAKAYDDPGIIAAITEDPDSNIKAIGRALTEASPAWAAMRREARAGAISPAVDVTRDLLDAVNLVRQARAAGRNVAEFVKQRDMFGGTISPEAEAFLRIMFRGEDFGQPRSAERVIEALSKYAEEARKTKAAPGLFGAAGVVSPLEILQHVRPEDRAAAQQPGLFTQQPGGAQAAGGSAVGARGQRQRPVGGQGGAEAPRPVGTATPRSLADAAQQQRELYEGDFAPGIPAPEMQATAEAVYGLRPEAPPKAEAPASVADQKLAEAQAMFEASGGEAHPEDAQEIARTEQAVDEADRARDALNEAGACLNGGSEA